MENIENELRGKIEHAFDISQIFDIFSSLVSAIKNQENKIKKLENDLQISNTKFNELAENVHTIEYNIQGFEIEDDELDQQQQQNSNNNNNNNIQGIENDSQTSINKLTPRIRNENRLKKQPTAHLNIQNSPLHKTRYETKVNVGEENVGNLITQPINSNGGDKNLSGRKLSTSQQQQQQQQGHNNNSTKVTPLSSQRNSPRLNQGYQENLNENDINHLETANQLISQAKENPSYRSSRNTSPRTTSAVIYPLPNQNISENDGVISNIPSHDPLDDHIHLDDNNNNHHHHNINMNNTYDPPLSPSGTSISSLTLLSSQLPDNSAAPSLKNTPRGIVSPLHSSRSHSSDTKNLKESLQIPQLKSKSKSPESTQRQKELDDMKNVIYDAALILDTNVNDEEDEFDKAMKEISFLDNEPLSVRPHKNDESFFQSQTESNTNTNTNQEHPTRLRSPLDGIRYHRKEDVVLEELSTIPSIEVSRSNIPTSREEDEKEQERERERERERIKEKEREKEREREREREREKEKEREREKDVSATTHEKISKQSKTITPSSSGVGSDRPTSKDVKKRRKGFFEPLDRNLVEDLENEKKGVGRSKLDPKLTVNNRLLALEDTIRVMSDVINAHHRALDAIPTKITKAVPVDMKTQLVRLANVIDRLDSGTLIKPLESRGNNLNSGLNSPEKKEIITEDTINQIIRRVLESIPQPKQEINIEELLNNSEIERIAKVMISEGYFDEFQRINKDKFSRDETINEEDNRPVTRGEINEMLDSAINIPLQLSIPYGNEDEIAPPHTSFSNSGTYSPIKTQLTGNYSGGGMSYLSSTPSFRQNGLSNDRHHSMSSYSTDTPLDTSRSHLIKGGLSEKFHHALSVQIQQNTQQYITHHDLDKTMKSSYHQIENELQKYLKSQKIESDASSYILNEKADRLEKNFFELQQIVNTIDINLKKHISSMLLKDKQSESENNKNGDWRPEIEKVNADIAKSMNDHKELAKALLIDLQQLQKDIQNRVDEQRINSLIEEIDGRIHKQIIEGVDPVNNSLAAVIRAIRNKADKTEMERILMERISQTEETIKRLEEQELESRDCAGGVRCLSCGSIGKGSHHIQVTNDPNIDASPGRNAGSDYDQLLAVLNRQAGLKPLSRQTKPLAPMTPITRPMTSSVVSPIVKKDGSTKGQNEPLYRRAKAANMMKEIPKIPMVSFGHSLNNPVELYHLDDENNQIQHSSSNSSLNSMGYNRQNPLGNIRLPRVPSQNTKS